MIDELDQRYRRYEKFGAYHWKALRKNIFFRDQLTHLRYCVASKYVPEVSIVLDVGCGDGAFFPYLIKRKICYYVGADLSLTGLRLAKSAFNRLKKVKAAYDLILCDGNFLPFRTGSLDIITNLEVLEHTSTPQDMLRELERVLNSARGICIFTLSEPLGESQHQTRYSKFYPLLLKVFKRVRAQGFFPRRARVLYSYQFVPFRKNSRHPLRLLIIGFRHMLTFLLSMIYANKRLEPRRSFFVIVLCNSRAR